MSQLPPQIPDQNPYVQSYQVQPINNDLSHLKTLAICHWVWGGIILFFSCIFLIYLILGIMFLSGNFPPPSNNSNNQGPPPEFLGYIFLVVGIVGPLIGWTLGGLTIYSGFCLKKQKRKMLSMIVAGINCISFPIGTTLGFFTFMVLARPTMKELYNQ